MKIIVDKDIPFIEGRIGDEAEVVYLPGCDINAEAVADADGLIVRTRTKCDKTLLSGSRVKVISTATIGTDHIDLEWCRQNGIKVFSAPGCNAPGVAQYVLSALLSQGFDPQTQTLGIIGYGNVGSMVGEWAGLLGIRILVNDPPKIAEGIKIDNHVDRETLLRESDAVTLHVPLISGGRFPTERLIGSRELKLMKQGTILVNSSRGGIVDEASLIPLLAEGKIKAIIDTWENEPQINRELLTLASVATPHIAGYSWEGKKRGTKMALEGLAEGLDIDINSAGLECVACETLKITRELIERSYNPDYDSICLKSNPEMFEFFRNKYDYRHEPQFR